MHRLLLVTLALVPGLSAAAAPQNAVPVSALGAHDWLLHVIPLPKEARIDARVTVPVTGLEIVPATPPASPGADLLARIRAQVEERAAGAQPAPGGARVTFRVGLLDARGALEGVPVPGAERLKGLKNADQAYLVTHDGAGSVTVAALDPKGLFYGIQTLWQLMQPTLRQQDGVWVIDVPLATLVDWPDLSERGEWGGSANRDIEWMAERKMNLVESHCKGLQVADDGKGSAEFDKALIARGAACAVKVVPIITHLDQLERTGLFRVFPDTLGKGDPAKWPYGGTTVKPACFSNPKTARVLADWMLSLAREPEVTDINVWLSEHHVTCECEACKQKGQFTLEAEAVAHGYALARQARPEIRLRVLLTQGSYAFNAQVIAALPREIGISYYDGGRTYDSSREPMIYPLLERYAAEGGWLSCYPQLTASWRIVCPWSGPQFIKARMVEFVDKKLESLCGYATPDNRFYDFNVTAAAEWSWNAHGRDEREFALAYFTRKGTPDPAKAADWAVLLGPVGWDVYGARVPYSWLSGRATQTLKEGKLPPLGEGPFRYLPDAAHLDANLEKCARALKLAQEVGDPALVAETRVIEGYLKMLQAIHALGQSAGGKKALTDVEKRDVARLAEALDLAASQTTEGLLAWQQAVAPDAKASRFDDTVQVTEATCVAVGEFLDTLGVADPGKPYRAKRAGAWKTEDFTAAPEATLRWEVTEMLAGPGRYLAKFVYTKGWYGLHITKTSLMSAPNDGPDQLTPVCMDEHPGTAAYRNDANTYELDLPAHEPNRRYFLVAEVRGSPKESPPDKQGCEGEVRFRKARKPAGSIR